MAGIFENSGRSWMATPAMGGNLTPLGFSQTGPQYQGYMNPEDVRMRQFVESMSGQPEDPASKARRLASEYANYMRSLRAASQDKLPYSDYISQFAMTPQQWSQAEAQRTAPKTITITGAAKTSVKSAVADPFIEVPVGTIGTGPLARQQTKKVRMSDYLAGEEAKSRQAGFEFQANARESLAMFKNMIANDAQVRNDPEMASKIGSGYEAISKGASPTDALAIVKGMGGTEAVKYDRKIRMMQAVQDFRRELAARNEKLSMDKFNKTFENQLALERIRQEWDAAQANWKNDINNADKQRQAAETAQRLAMAYKSQEADVIPMITAYQKAISDLNAMKPTVGTPEYSEYQAKLKDLEDGLKKMTDIRDYFNQIPNEIKTRPTGPISPTAPTPQASTSPQSGYMRVRFPDGSTADLSAEQLSRAKAAFPNLEVIAGG